MNGPRKTFFPFKNFATAFASHAGGPKIFFTRGFSAKANSKSMKHFPFSVNECAPRAQKPSNASCFSARERVFSNCGERMSSTASGAGNSTSAICVERFFHAALYSAMVLFLGRAEKKFFGGV